MLLLIKAGTDPNACYLRKRIDHAPKTTDSNVDKDILRVRTPLDLVRDTNPNLAFLKNNDELRDSLVSQGAVMLGFEKVINCLGADYRYDPNPFKFPQEIETEISQNPKERLEEDQMSKIMAEEETKRTSKSQPRKIKQKNRVTERGNGGADGRGTNDSTDLNPLYTSHPSKQLKPTS